MPAGSCPTGRPRGQLPARRIFRGPKSEGSQTCLPAIYPTVVWTDAGGLMYYGANIPDLCRRAATFVDKILKGAKPAEFA